MQSTATLLLNGAAVTARDAEMTVADQFEGGANEAGSNACGIGIATGNGECKLSDWTLNDQAGDARTPQQSQHIGGDGLGEGDRSDVDIIAFGTTTNSPHLVSVAAGWIIV